MKSTTNKIIYNMTENKNMNLMQTIFNDVCRVQAFEAFVDNFANNYNFLLNSITTTVSGIL